MHVMDSIMDFIVYNNCLTYCYVLYLFTHPYVTRG